MENRKKILLGCLFAFLSETIFGISYIFTKLATDVANTFDLLFWRGIVAFLTMTVCIVLGFVKVDYRGKKIGPLLLISLFNPIIYFIGETFGIKYTSASESGVILACIPIASLILSAVFLHKKPFKNQVIGIIISLIGITVTVVAVSFSITLSVPGYLLLILAVFSYGMYTVQVERTKGYTNMEITYVMLISSAIFYAVVALIVSFKNGSVNELLTIPFKSSVFTFAVLFQGVLCSMGGLLLATKAISLIGANRTSSFIGVSTVMSILGSVIFLHESFSIYQVIGAAIIIIGIYIANYEITKN